MVPPLIVATQPTLTNINGKLIRESPQLKSSSKAQSLRTADSTFKVIWNTLVGFNLFVPSPLRNPGYCQINDKAPFTSRPEVCSA